MYSPQIFERNVRAMYRLKQILNKPITAITNTFLEAALSRIDKNPVCERCKQHNLDSDCNECFFGDKDGSRM
ncbi:hypothetical protein GF336_05615 [Candidatus Woesearchaeota archaeon]|nr:hypothetical protein [Candidatus Woesearchaeota archaeon]